MNDAKWDHYQSELRLFMKHSFNRIVDQSLEQGDLTQEHVEWLISLPLDTVEQQDRAYAELTRFHLETRLIKGATYLERTDLTPRQREKGMKLYDQLCSELDQIPTQRLTA